MKNNFKGSPLFNDIADAKLKTWNRCAIVFNLMADRGQEAVTQYVSQFSSEDKKLIKEMFTLIEQFGYENVRKKITVNLVA